MLVCLEKKLCNFTQFCNFTLMSCFPNGSYISIYPFGTMYAKKYEFGEGRVDYCLFCASPFPPFCGVCVASWSGYPVTGLSGYGQTNFIRISRHHCIEYPLTGWPFLLFVFFLRCDWIYGQFCRIHSIILQRIYPATGYSCSGLTLVCV